MCAHVNSSAQQRVGVYSSEQSVSFKKSGHLNFFYTLQCHFQVIPTQGKHAHKGVFSPFQALLPNFESGPEIGRFLGVHKA